MTLAINNNNISNAYSKTHSSQESIYTLNGICIIEYQLRHVFNDIKHGITKFNEH